MPHQHPLIVVVWQVTGNRDSPRHVQHAQRDLVEESAIELGQRHRVASNRPRDRDARLVQILDAGSGVAEELRRIDRRTLALGDVDKCALRPRFLGRLRIQPPHENLVRAGPLRQVEAVMSVDDVGLLVGGIVPDRHHASKFGVVRRDAFEFATNAGLRVRLQFELEPLGIDMDGVWVHVANK